MRASLHLIFRFVLGLAVGSLVFEIYLRTVEATSLWRVLPVAEAALYGPSLEAGYTHRSGARGIWITENRAPVAINALGLRDALDRTLAKPAGARRLAIVGDSIVEALQVPLEETFVARTQAELRRRGHAGVEVLNLGLAGARPAVMVERLRHATRTLGIDGAIVLVSAGDFLGVGEDDASELVGYVAGPGGRGVLSHAFRGGRGFRLRTSEIGRGIYWTLDHIRLALVLNNRKNVGFAAELAALPAVGHRVVANTCGEADMQLHEAVWTERTGSFADARLTAFLADLAGISKEIGLPVVLALRGLPVGCPASAAGRKRLVEIMAARATAAGLVLVDHDTAMEAHLGGRSRGDLLGFGSRIGNGHLNADGHRVYAAAITDVIAAHSIDRR